MLTLDARQFLDDDFLVPPGISNIQLSTAAAWPKWNNKTEHHSRECEVEFTSLLKSLQHAPHLTKTNMFLQDILDLPLRQDPKQRTPISVLRSIGVHAQCRDVGLWTLTDFPAVDITHSPTRLALAKSRTSGDKASWHAFVAATGNATYEAFDYTADFHSRDLDGKDNNAWIDLGVMGRGYWRLPGGLDRFSCNLASDLDHNISYFEDCYDWRPNLYVELQEKGGVVSSQLGGGSREEAASVELSCDVWELSDSALKQVVGMLRLKEDEEVVYEGKRIRKVKKVKSDE